MILVKITNSTEVVASKTHKLFAKVTPEKIDENLVEAEVLSGHKITSDKEVMDAAIGIFNEGANAVVIKGGHMGGDYSSDIFYDGETFHEFNQKRICLGEVHGTGCAFSAAITVGLSCGDSLFDSVSMAKKYITKALELTIDTKGTNGLIDHFYEFRGR